MNNDSFWNLTEKLGGQDDSILDKMSTDELIDYYKTIEMYRGKAYTREIFEIGAILNGMGLSDEGVVDFTCWLVFKGKKIFETALHDPDAISEIKIDQETIENHEFYGCCDDVLDVLFERIKKDPAILKKLDKVKRPEITEYYEINTDTLAKKYPKLWAKYGKRYLQLEKEIEDLKAKFNLGDDKP